MSRKTLSTLLLLAFSLSLILAGCGGQAPQQAKVLRVGADATFAPFEFQDEKSKEYVGFDIDLIKAVVKQLGYEVKIQGMGFDGLIPALEAGQVDAVISAMTITAERAQKVNFSKPYYTSGLSIVVKQGDAAVKEFKDLEGKRLAVQIGTTGADFAKKVKDAKIREFNTAPEAFLELKAGGVDAVINDLPVNEYYIAKFGSKDAKIVGKPLNSEDYGIATAKKNTELAQKIDKALDDIKKSGEYDKIYEKWFGRKPAK
jgi:polar amino acid transport system substrate-binding protein